MKELFEELASELESSIPEFSNDTVLFSEHGYTSIPLTKSHFQMIRDSYSESTVCFIDGGNAELFSSASFSLQFIRVYATFYKDNKRIQSKKYEFFTLVTTEVISGKVMYHVKTFSEKGDFMNDFSQSFDSQQVYTHKTPLRVPISEIGNVVRRFSEITCAQKCIPDLSSRDIIVLDGNLHATYSGEKDILEGLYVRAQQNTVVISALAKTSRLLTTNANSVTALLANLCQGAWLYHPVVDIVNESHRAELCFAKLHENSEYVFRIDIFKPQKEHMHEIVSFLKKNACDPVFLGYPYGLIDADKFARVSQQEQEQLRLRIKMLMKSEKLKPYLNTLNAHSILDSIL